MAKNPETEHPVQVFGWAARDTSGVLSPFKFSRRATGDYDVQFKVLYCGICHSDIHMLKNEWGFSQYPLVPGHEIVGEVTEVGSKVQKVKVGDKVGVGCLVRSCRECDQCSADLENYCPKQVLTYGTPDIDGSITHGGYSTTMVATEHFIFRWPDNLPLDKGAPLLCAGITTYSPMKYFGLDKPGLAIGVAGLGGLGHVAVKFAKAFGAKVTVISTSESKKKEAIEQLGVDNFVVSKDPEQMQAAAGTLDGILDTISADHGLVPFLNLLKPHGKLVLVGAPEKPLELPAFPIIAGRKTVVGSANGPVKETQEMLDFAAAHGITADIELISADYVNKAIERLQKADVKYRFVIDVGKTMKPERCKL
ncbi:Cinnamyl alcohol dehydrogenase 7 [Striga hermonthica]|uniref:Cinnamyl alcohol dehydrogenase 7 n=1 Tax=Striga hermonthica TaxID=68872 RepID=A0A9N7RHN4_STRHE|nr:Cinnamyl alcohol dehydrogenase 7 [Striga hermonthica]